MKKAMRLCFTLVLLGVIASCQQRGMITNKVKKVVKKEKTVNYRDISVPEEGGIKFTKFTEEYENVMGPSIASYEGVISWYTPSLIAISPDGDQVAYTAKKDNKTNIYIKNTKGGRSTIQRTFRDQVLDMSFSGDGKYIIFTEKVNEDYDILQINSTQGAAIQQISATSYRESSPIYSPSGDYIFYTQGEYSSATQSYNYYLWSIDRKSYLKTQYSAGFNPAISSKDKNLVIVCRNNKESGRGEIYSINLDSGQETLILSRPEMGFSSPSIHPNGKIIAVVGTTLGTTKRKENLDIYTINTDGTDLTQLTFHPGHDVSPVWGPDGKEIYFSCQRGNENGSWDIWKMDYKRN